MQRNERRFIIRLWREHRDPPGAPSLWRGEIEDVMTGARRFFEDPAVVTRQLAAVMGLAGRRLPKFLSRWFERGEER